MQFQGTKCSIREAIISGVRAEMSEAATEKRG